jgi:anti-sigma factor RsiW
MSTTLEPGLSCREMVELMTDYLDGALTPSDHARFESHIDACPHCTAYLEQIRATIRTTGALSQADLEASVPDALLAAFRTWKTER